MTSTVVVNSSDQTSSTRNTDLLFLGLYFVLALSAWIIGRQIEPDANFIAYRFANNLANGRGLVYLNPGLPVSTFPLIPVLLAILLKATLSAPLAGGIISILGVTVGAWALARLTDRRWAGLAYVVLSVQLSLVIYAMLAFALLGLLLLRRNRFVWAGIFMGLAILAEPSAIILGALTLILAVSNGGGRRYFFTAFVISVLGIAATSLSLAPAGASPISLISIVPEVFTLLLAVAATLIFILRFRTLADKPYITLLAIWSISLVLVAILAGNRPSAAVLPGIIAIVSSFPFLPLVTILAVLDVVISIVILPRPSGDMLTARDVGLALAKNPSATTLATDEIGALSFYAGLPIIDLSGKIQANPQANPFDKAFFIRNAPDVVLLHNGQTSPWEPFKTTYAHVDTLQGREVYQRVVNFADLDNHGVDVPFGVVGRDDLHLSNVALGNKLHPGDLVRVRLDWTATYLPKYDIEIKLDLLNEGNGSVASALDKLPPWQGKQSSYHLLVLPGKLPAGKLSLYLAVGAYGGTFGTLKISEVTVVP